MGKKARPPLRAGEKSAKEEASMGLDDDEADAEAAALLELEAEREAEELELDMLGDNSNTEGRQQSRAIYNRSGLDAAREQQERNLPWIERLDIVATEDLDVPDVHDDLTRETAFYEQALAAAKVGRDRFDALGVPWQRPDDFFCEMLKSDAHMAKVKDKLIFEQKKMEAFEQRKQRQAQRKFSKAKAATLAHERSAAKKESIDALNKWRKDNKDRRRGALDDDDDAEIDALMGIDGGNNKRKRDGGRDSNGPSKKRQGLNKKYGFGGPKSKKMTRNDHKVLNRDDDFSPRQMKARSGAQTGKRPGKDARQQKRQKNRKGGPGR